MIVATREKIPEILAYLRQDIGSCVYMYIDIAKYGIGNPNVTVWYEQDAQGLTCVVTKYYDSIQVFTHTGQGNADAMAQLVMQYRVGMVSGRLDLVEQIYARCSALYELHSGYVYRFRRYDQIPFEGKVEHAAEADLDKIARLICSDEALGGHYAVDSLASQFAERMRTGMGRHHIIRRGDAIAAHMATYAEYEDIAVISGLIVDPAFRGQRLGTVVEGNLVRELLDEGKQVYVFLLSERRVKQLTQMDCRLCGRYGKLTLRKRD